MSFRGINTTVIQIRRQVFTEVARMAYANVKGEQANHLMRKIPYTIIPGEEGKLRKDIFLERAIVEERVRLAMGSAHPPHGRAQQRGLRSGGCLHRR